MDTRRIASTVADASWILSFMTSWGLLLALWDTWWAPLLGTVFLFHLAGLSEFMHQTVHLNLFARNRRLNRVLGTFAGAVIGVDFDTYRTFHLDHHRYTNTPRDPEHRFYKDPSHQETAAGWQDLTPREKIERIPRVMRFAAAALTSFGGDRSHVRVMQWAIPIVIALTGLVAGLPWYLVPVKVVATWYLPLFLLLFVDFLFAQSEHYGTDVVAGKGALGTLPLAEQYQLSWNLMVPAILAFILLKRNLHAEHHLTPSIHWTQVRDQGAGRALPFRDYLSLLWRQGPRK